MSAKIDRGAMNSRRLFQKLPKLECRATHASGLACTLPPGHAGEHVVQAIDVREVLRWPARAPGFEAVVAVEPESADDAL